MQNLAQVNKEQKCWEEVHNYSALQAVGRHRNQRYEHTSY